MQNLPSYFNLITRLILSAGGIFAMFIFPSLFGRLDSYSSYYQHSPILFTLVFSILAVGLYIHSNIEWRYPAVLLIILSTFNMHDFPGLHYSSAILFFLSSTYSMWNDKRVSGFGKLSALLYTLFFIDLLVFEAAQVILICIFHLIYIFKVITIKINY